jgi:hypothetical protein
MKEKPSAIKREHPALQKMKLIKSFLCLRVIFALVDPDPDRESGSVNGFSDPIESGSNLDRIRIRIYSTGVGSGFQINTC